MDDLIISGRKTHGWSTSETATRTYVVMIHDESRGGKHVIGLSLSLIHVVHASIRLQADIRLHTLMNNVSDHACDHVQSDEESLHDQFHNLVETRIVVEEVAAIDCRANLEHLMDVVDGDILK